MAGGRLVPEFPLDRIDQRGVARRDMGDLDPLVESLQRFGLLTPIVVTTDGLLVCGARRLAAAKVLGWLTVPVWIPERVSPELRQHAMYAEHTLAMPLSPIEQAELYAEYEALYKVQAGLRCEATRFQPGHVPGCHGGVESSTPPAMPVVSSRSKAAQAVTRTDSFQRLEQIRDLQHIAADSGEHPLVQQDAVDALVEINAGGKVAPVWRRVVLHQALAELDRVAADLGESDARRTAAREAAALVRTQPSDVDASRFARQVVADLHSVSPPTEDADDDVEAAARRQVVDLVGLLRREYGWWTRYDPTVFARHATTAQWRIVDAYTEAATKFLREVGALRV